MIQKQKQSSQNTKANCRYHREAKLWMCWLVMTPAAVAEDQDDGDQDDEGRRDHREEPHVHIDVHQVCDTKPQEENGRDHQNLKHKIQCGHVEVGPMKKIYIMTIPSPIF